MFSSAEAWGSSGTLKGEAMADILAVFMGSSLRVGGQVRLAGPPLLWRGIGMGLTVVIRVRVCEGGDADEDLTAVSLHHQLQLPPRLLYQLPRIDDVSLLQVPVFGSQARAGHLFDEDLTPKAQPKHVDGFVQRLQLSGRFWGWRVVIEPVPALIPPPFSSPSFSSLVLVLGAGPLPGAASSAVVPLAVCAAVQGPPPAAVPPWSVGAGGALLLAPPTAPPSLVGIPPPPVLGV
ncbi:hypothetical protein F7725_013372 [Dissostichus mawsoni]|uniref:Uncharacterized protein n=1 Tax=Dissostichus mawsoni TaxID=36200 RepID=A0A7J5YQC1_DISMA|nr:hypothetical protein F7725_013372 [Dissostichus mawsoni]